jgi:transcription termination factor Rho
MTAEQQLERSVLEGKERDELHAIAQALSVKTNTRTKKADIIEGILQAAGVPSSGSSDGEAPARAPRASRSRSGSDRSAGSAQTADTQTTDAQASDARVSNGTDATSEVSTATPAPKPASRRPRPTQSFDPRADVSSSSDVSSELDYDYDIPSTGSAKSEGSTGSEAEGSAAASPDSGSDASTGGQTRQQGQGNRNNQGGQNNQGGRNQGGQNNQGNRNQGGQNNQGNRNNQGGRNNQGNQNNQGNRNQGNDDMGNRRGNRRRRGRDRQGPDGDLVGYGNADQAYSGETIPVRGLLDLRDEGYGFVRCSGYLPSNKDVYVSVSQAKRFALRKGDTIEGTCRPAGSQEKFPALLQIDTVSGLDPEVAKLRPRFEDLTPLFPDEKLHLEMPGEKEDMTARIVDLLSPIGKGQRGLIVSPPKAGKTTVMKHIAHSIEANNPDVHLMVLLVDERPEEVTDMRRSVKGEVIASTFDRPSEEHTAVAEVAIERAKRLVESGRDVVIILDGITRLARAYNLAQPATGRIMSGGVDSGALYPPKKFFGAARNIEEGGSLTILATALVETGSKMDEVIFEEFKGTGNMELRLDRRLAERRLYPSIDVNASSTRHEELLFDRSQLQQVWKLRRVLNALANEGSAAAGLELLMDKIRTTKSNDEFLAEIAKGPAT